ncbi:MAG: PIN domain-containing protein [Gammaproteobacteria bacterium SHHR-1]|jgi:predicted nucleic acid-binding protein|uniref:type II toxin-antitoxin system VapC family toxin n=1 Tax=Magnetovirga frankeli TaxID=947516 RepID=UPI001AF927BA|nr:PIN domain-containing protein [gamma proteobacterium SS-5]
MLVDTSVWVAWLRGTENPATVRLDRLLNEEAAWLAPVILQELLQGARNAAELNTLRREFACQPMLRATTGSYLLAGELYARCRWQGLTIRSPHDCLIAALAVENDIPLLTLDLDFKRISQVEPRLVLLTR